MTTLNFLQILKSATSTPPPSPSQPDAIAVKECEEETVPHRVLDLTSGGKDAFVVEVMALLLQIYCYLKICIEIIAWKMRKNYARKLIPNILGPCIVFVLRAG